MQKNIFSLLFMLITTSLITLQAYAQRPMSLKDIKLPAGFSISIYADNIEGARQMALSPSGTVFVGSRNGNIYALPNKSKNFHKADKVLTIASGLNAPNGVAFHNGSLYVAEIDKIIRFDDIDKHLNNPSKPITIVNNLPNKTYHGNRYIKFGPNNWLYIGIGAPCNVCIKTDKRFATIMRMHPNGQDQEIYAKGIRDTLGFDWDQQQKLWFTDNGRDWLGDNLPPDELNYAPEPGMNFGFPFYYGNNIPDPTYGKYPQARTISPVAPAYGLPAHVATLGMTFYKGKMFPKKYRNQIFIAEHGSWNRSKKIGYRVSMVTLNGNMVIDYKPFASGWLQGQNVSGRPNDVLMLPDGSLLVSDDYNGIIYRISYRASSSQPEPIGDELGSSW